MSSGHNMPARVIWVMSTGLSKTVSPEVFYQVHNVSIAKRNDCNLVLRNFFQQLESLSPGLMLNILQI